MKKNNTYPTHTKFPWKKCWIATVVILIVATIALSLFYAIATNHPNNDKSWIFFLVWGIVFGLMLIMYWSNQIMKYIKTRKDEQ
jgi:uncharacterized membrane protein YdjX (TVP38/TMEM64 family)